MLFLKAKLLSPDSYSILLIERFFKIIMSGLSLLKEGANASFVLLLLKMKFKEALKLKALDDAILELEQNKESVLKPLNQNANAFKQESKSADKIEKPEKKENTETPQTPMLSAKDRIFHNLFKQVQTLVYERNYELGAVFEKNIRFIDFDSQTKTLTWESLATHKDKELLRERFKIVKSIVDGVFGKGENIKIALKNQNKSALEEIKELKFPSLKPKPTTETTAEMKEKETKEKEIKEVQENDTKEVQEIQPKETSTALQEFMANHSDLIEEIKSEFEIKSVELL
ncbi:hypothetical protein BTM381_13380 [Helicobacter pylori]